MSNSTRAKEMRAKRRKKKKKQPEFTYSIESPDGIYTNPEKKKRKFIVKREEENKKGPEPQNGMVELIESAAPEALDVQIPEINQPFSEGIFEEDNIKGKKKKNKGKSYSKKQSIKDYDSFEDARKIKNDIADIRGNISFRIMVLLIMTVFSVYIAVGETLKLPVPEMLSISRSPEIYSWVQILLLLLSMIVSFGTIKNGLISLIKFRADSDSLTALTCIASAVSAVPAILDPQMLHNEKFFIYTPVAVLSLLINAFGKRLILSRASLNFDFISTVMQ